MPKYASNKIDPRNLQNDIITLQMLREKLEHDRLILLKYDGDPFIDDKALYNLKLLSSEIFALKRAMNLMEIKSEMIKKSYFKSVSRKLDCHIRLK